MPFQVGIGSLGGTVLFHMGLCTSLQTMEVNSANQWAGFYMILTSFIKELTCFYPLQFYWISLFCSKHFIQDCSLKSCKINLKSFEYYLKLVSTIVYQMFIFSPNDSPSKTMKNVFYFIEKALFVLEIFKFL